MALVVDEENGMIMKTERPKYSKKILSEGHFVQKNFMWTSLDTNSGLHFDRPATTNTTEQTYIPSIETSFLPGLLLAAFRLFQKATNKQFLAKNTKKCNLTLSLLTPYICIAINVSN
jgi:hypothetical protein